MTIDIEHLSAAELDELIDQAGKRRATLKPEVPSEAPKIAHAIFNPSWYVSPTKDGSLLQFRHQGFGWVAFLIPQVERAQLMTFLLQQAILPAPSDNATVAPSTTPASGSGGTFH